MNRMMERVREILTQVQAVITGSHVVYASGRHGSAYVNKDAVYPHTHATSEICDQIARAFTSHNVEVVIAPAVGGVILSQWVAYHLTNLLNREVLGVYADQIFREEVLFDVHENSRPVIVKLPFGGPNDGPTEVTLLKGDRILIKRAGSLFVIKRGYDKLLHGKRVLVVEDVLTTGGSVRKVVEAVRQAGGEVVGVGAICNRGRVTAEDVGGVPELFATINPEMESFPEDECSLCAQGVPVNTDVGKGRDFLARKAAPAG